MNQKLKERVTKVKFLNGESACSKEDLAILNAWFKEFGVDTMHTLFEQRIIAGNPMKAAGYCQSSLHTLFKDASSS